MTIAITGDTVKVHYTGSLDDGTVFDSSSDREPIEFTIGDHAVIQGFEDAVLGMRVGSRRRVVVAPEDAYGPHLKNKIFVVDRSQLPDEVEPAAGMMLEGRSPEGNVVFIIVEVSGDQVTLDGNHPLAGHQLTFELEMQEIVRP